MNLIGMKSCAHRRSGSGLWSYALTLLTFCIVIKDELILRRALYKLYHIEESLKENASAIRKTSRDLDGFREDQHRQQQVLDRARADQAKSKTEVSREERKLKRAEKALETKVRATFHYDCASY